MWVGTLDDVGNIGALYKVLWADGTFSFHEAGGIQRMVLLDGVQARDQLVQ